MKKPWLLSPLVLAAGMSLAQPAPAVLPHPIPRVWDGGTGRKGRRARHNKRVHLA